MIPVCPLCLLCCVDWGFSRDAAKQQPSVKEQDKATCRPYNEDDFAARVETYRVTTWFNKPKALSAVQCARYGWINTKEDLLTCITCRAVLNCHLDGSLESASSQCAVCACVHVCVCACVRVRDRVSLYRFAFDVIDVHVCCSFLATAHKLVKQFGERLVSQHKQWCPWRTNFCTEEMAAPPLSTKEEELSKLATRFAREPLFVRVVAWACLCVCVCVRVCAFVYARCLQQC